MSQSINTTKVVIASTNPVKIKAASTGFQTAFPQQTFEFIGVSVPSGVSDQPMTEGETHTGAMNRIKNTKELIPDAHYWVGIEGGLQENNGIMEAFAYIIISSDTKTGESKTSSFGIPDKVSDLVKQGYELGHADDIVFGSTNSKQNNGSVGILTHDIITRSSYYEQSVILALIPFMNAELY